MNKDKLISPIKFEHEGDIWYDYGSFFCHEDIHIAIENKLEQILKEYINNDDKDINDLKSKQEHE